MNDRPKRQKPGGPPENSAAAAAQKAFDSDLTAIHVHAGDYRVVTDPGVMLTTVLGSCISACILDPTTGAGGMNHFILPHQRDIRDAGPSERYGEFAMRALVDALYALGAKRSALQAKLFGGAKVILGSANIGAMNADFARNFLHDEGIRLVGEGCGGEAGRRIKFHPATGRVQEDFIQSRPAQILWPQLLQAPTFAPLRPICVERSSDGEHAERKV